MFNLACLSPQVSLNFILFPLIENKKSHLVILINTTSSLLIYFSMSLPFTIILLKETLSDLYKLAIELSKSHNSLSNEARDLLERTYWLVIAPLSLNQGYK